MIRAALAAHGGKEISTQGDGFFAVFSSASACAAASIEMQRAFAAHGWPEMCIRDSDRSLLVLPPDAAARTAILAYHLRDRATAILSVASVVAITEDFSGADLRLVCDEAAQRALAEAARTGIAKPISETDLKICLLYTSRCV